MASVSFSSKAPAHGGYHKNSHNNYKPNPMTGDTTKTNSKPVTPPNRSNNNNNNNKTKTTASTASGLGRRMVVDKNVVDELLLVCGVIGTTTETTSNGVEMLVPVTDCLNWLQDLQRALRRDEDLYRPISLLMGKWNVVQKKLLPLVLTCRYDTPMILTIVKILVILTKPLHENTMRAGRLIIDTKSNKVPEDVIEEQKKLRENALAQSDMLMEYKKAIIHHPSHRRNGKNGSSNDDDDDGGILSIFVSLLAEPLSKTGTKRTEADHLTIELVLHLFRNILSAEPILKGSQETSLKSTQLHHECISLFERELVLDILLVICQEMELRENAQYNLLMMELLHHLLKSQDPTGVARCMMTTAATTELTIVETSRTSTAKENNNKNRDLATNKEGIAKASQKSSTHHGLTSGLLRSQLARDKQQFRTAAPTRHGNFGGTLMLKRPDGKQKYVSASAVLSRTNKDSGPSVMNTNAAGPKKRKNRKTEPFIGSGRTLLSHTRVGQLQNAQRGPAAIRAQKTLHRFCQTFLERAYGPVMKSLKNEFRRDSVRLEGDDDKVVFFRIIWFFFQWFRVFGFGNKLQASTVESSDETNKESNGSTSLGQLIFTMDVFSFNLVLNATTTFITHKQYVRLAQTVALYAEMMHMLHSMYHSKDPTEQLMALGLMDRLFYGAEPVDRLPKLLSSWIPGIMARDYVCDLVEICHVTLKLLEANKKACAEIMESEQAQQAIVNKKGKKKKIQTNNAVLQMKVAAADFDVTSYFVRKIVSSNVVFMYTKLLEQYSVNSNHVNHRIVAFFLRLAKITIVDGEEEQQQVHLGPDGTEPLKNLLAPKVTTLEPMLYNIHLILVLNKILNDPIIRNDKAYETTLSWAAGVIHNFATLASSNPILFVECLFKHPVPHRFCELSTNMYVSEELRMIAERELLLEAQRLEALNGDQSDDDDDMEQDEELEFVDIEEESAQSPQTFNKRRSRVGSDSFSDEEGQDETSRQKPKAITKKRRRLSKKIVQERDEESSDEEELVFETTAASSTPATVAESSKSKGKSVSLDDSSDEEYLLVEKGTKSPAKLASPKNASKSKTSNRDVLADSSDEELELDDEISRIAGKEKRSENLTSARRFAFDESSDEGEDEDEDGDEKSTKKMDEEKQNLRKAAMAMDDSSSDEAEDEYDDGPDAVAETTGGTIDDATED